MVVTLVNYLTENGNGEYERWHVPDLLPERGSETELVFVFESPHVHELERRVPVVGASGRDALRFLLTDSRTDQSLGCFVRERLSLGDGRIAIMNVSNVPLQVAAFDDAGAPDLSATDWISIERIRKSSARSVAAMRGGQARVMSETLVRGLRDRLDALALGPGCQVAAAGVFAQRMVGALPDVLTPGSLRVPHPSFNQWNWAKNQDRPELIEVRRLFTQTVSGHSAGA